MVARLPDSKWRLLVSLAPLLGVAYVVCATVQGESEVARSTIARGVLAGIAALGALVAAWTARQRRAPPPLPVAQASVLAQAGQLADVVALSGLARALPGAAPLIAPSGELCLWFRPGEPRMHRQESQDSVHPFLLVDASGPCIVLPSGAAVSGGSPGESVLPPGTGAEAASAVAAGGERLLRDGDTIHVVGRFVPRSVEAMSLQDRAAALALPVIAAPRVAAPFLIRIGKDESEEELFGLLALVDTGVMLLSGGMFAWGSLL